ncbi:alpha/beta hydrolase [bacterium SCSIO 12741]|nr:alpha/beta hydrolase [bacterium SCSIO 12741]
MEATQMQNDNIQLSKFNIKQTMVGKLNYTYLQEGKGHPIFFLHGFPDHAGAWDDLITELAESNTCISPFLRGYYPTDIPKDHDYSALRIAEDIHALALKLDLKEYTVVGHDWGATVAYIMANLYPLHVKRVIALNMPHPKFLKPSLKLLLKARHILYFANRSKSITRLSKNNYAYLDTLYKRWSPKLSAEQLKLEMVHCFEKPWRKEAALGYYWQLGKERKQKERLALYQQLPTIPTLVLIGQKDGTVDLNQFKKMEAEHCFNLRYHNEAGHFLHREATNFCIQQIQHFIQE